MKQNFGEAFKDSWLANTALQRHNTENLKHMFPEKELRGLSPNFHIYVSVGVLFIYSHDRSAHSSAGKYVDRS